MFDVPPEAVLPSSQGISAEVARIISTFQLDSHPNENTVSVYPPKFKLRLQNAMEKNLKYIEKLDAGIIEDKPKVSAAVGGPAKSKLLNMKQSLDKPGMLAYPIYNNTEIVDLS